jgi:hypothetical protein
VDRARYRNAYIVLVGKPEVRDHLEDINVDRKTVTTLNKMKGLGLDSYSSGEENWRAVVNTVMNS